MSPAVSPITYIKLFLMLNPIPDEHFWGGSRMWQAKRLPLCKISYKYPTMMKLVTVMRYLRKIKNIHESSDTLLEFVEFC